MSDVVEELKAKLAEKKDRLEAIRVEQAALEEEVIAFETVIACYDPSIRPSGRLVLDGLFQLEASLRPSGSPRC